MARALAQAGASVAIAARHADELEAALAAILEGTGARGAWLVADMADRDDVERLAREAAEALGPIDILVNNAGINRVSPIDEVPDADWDHVLAVNLTAPMILSRALAGPMKQRRLGPDHPHQLGLRRGQPRRAQRLQCLQGGPDRPDPFHGPRAGPARRHRQRHPARPFETPLTATMHPDPAAETMVHRPRPHGPMGTPEELAGPLLLLASDAGCYITGTCLAVDGGWLAQ